MTAYLYRGSPTDESAGGVVLRLRADDPALMDRLQSAIADLMR